MLKIGSEGEIFLPKDLREMLGFEPDQAILLHVQKDLLILRKVHSLEELLQSPPKVKISYHAWKQIKEEINDEINS